MCVCAVCVGHMCVNKHACVCVGHACVNVHACVCVLPISLSACAIKILMVTCLVSLTVDNIIIIMSAYER